MNRINQLEPNIASQIAAGEVIERPSSVVKELLENSLDSGADQIKIDIEDGGISKIKITDNGCGIHHQDLKLSVTPHATSKISNIEDLVVVKSLGFRGEALASIGSIAKMQVISKQSENLDAKKMIVEGGIIHEPVGGTGDIGTTVLVEDLFYNVPVRRKFLKSNKTEIIHIDNMIKKIMLSRFDKRYQVYYEGKQVYNLPAATNVIQIEKRIEKILSKTFLHNAVNIEAESPGISLKGWICLPSLERRQSDWQYFYLNNRIIRDKLIQHAIRQAYADRLDSNFQPAYVLYLSIDSSDVDVNVHPTKNEVRFKDSRYIHDFLVSALQKALSEPEAKKFSFSEQHLPMNTDAEEKLSSSIIIDKSYEVGEVKANPLGKIIGILKNKFVLSENLQGLVVIDIKEMYSQLFYLELQNTDLIQIYKTLIIPETVSFEPRKARAIELHLDLLKQFGIYIELLSDLTFVVRKANRAYKGINFKQLLDDTFIISKELNCKESLQIALANAKSNQFSCDDIYDEIHKDLRIYEQYGSHHVSYRGINIWRIFSLGQLTELL